MATHRYMPEGTSDCAYGCGCWMGPFTSGGPDGIDPFGECPKAPPPAPKKPTPVQVERARIREGLLKEIAKSTERIEGSVCSQPGSCKLPEHVLAVVPVEDLLAALDRICPASEGKE